MRCAGLWGRIHPADICFNGRKINVDELLLSSEHIEETFHYLDRKATNQLDTLMEYGMCGESGFATAQKLAPRL